MFLCGQMYSPYIQLWKLPESYRTNLKVTPVTRPNEDILETSLNGFPLSINIITQVIEA